MYNFGPNVALFATVPGLGSWLAALYCRSIKVEIVKAAKQETKAPNQEPNSSKRNVVRSWLGIKLYICSHFDYLTVFNSAK